MWATLIPVCQIYANLEKGLMASISKYQGKKGITWNVRVRKNGKYITGAFPTRRMAEDWAASQERDLVQEKYFPTSTQKPLEHTVNELLDLYEARNSIPAQ
jgi:hypothetical protein